MQRYIRLTFLTKELLDLVDEEKIKLIPAVELSFLDTETQRNLYEVMFLRDKYTVSLSQAKALRQAADGNRTLSEAQIEVLLFPTRQVVVDDAEKQEEAPAAEKSEQAAGYAMPSVLDQYFPSEASLSERWSIIEALVKKAYQSGQIEVRK